MKKSLFLLAISACVISLVGCGEKEIKVQSQWSDSADKVGIDGNSEDWDGVSMEYFEKSGVSLGLRNDAKNLYILLSFRDEPLARFFQSKVTLWLDKTGKKKKDFGIRYTGSMAPGQQENRPWENFAPEHMEKLFQRQSGMQGMITVLEKDKSVLIPVNSEQGPAVATTHQRGIYCHEVRIPLQKSDSTPYAIDVAPGDTISVGAELGSSRGEHQKMGEEMGGGMPGGGMPPGGGMGGGMPGGRGGPTGGMRGGKQMPEKQEIWLKIILASKPKN